MYPLDSVRSFHYNRDMKNKINYIVLLLLSAVFVLFLMVPVAQGVEDLKDRPDSIMHVLGITVDNRILEEYPGNEIRDLRLYITNGQANIVWQFETGYYVYSLTDQITAMELFKQIQTNGIKTFIANREGNIVKFQKFYKVIAFQIAVTNDVN